MMVTVNNTDISSVLTTRLPGKVSLPGQPAYDASKNSYFFQEARLSPACIVFPSSAIEVSLVIKRLAAFRNESSSPPLVAIRGGGHTPFSGAANVDDGVTIDLSRLNEVELANSHTAPSVEFSHPQAGIISPSNSLIVDLGAQVEGKGSDTFVISIGGGANWGDVYTKLQSFDITVVGGRGLSLGVGGLLTGGGISFFSPKRGFACDNVINMEVVLADGSVVNTNAREHPDLFKALKGGSNNFGVVTRFDLQAFSQGNFWGGFLSYPSSTVPQQLAAFSSFMRGSKSDLYGSVICAIGFVGVYQKVVVSIGLHYMKEVSDPVIFQPFTSIRPQLNSTIRIANHLDFATEIESKQPKDSRGIYVNTVFSHTDSIVEEVHQLWSSTVDSIRAIPGVAYFLIFQPLPSIRPGLNSLGLDDVATEDPLVLCELSVTWDLAKDDSIVKLATQSLVDRIDQATKAVGLFRNSKYLNYAASFQDPISSYGLASRSFLQSVSRKYDPTEFFQKSVPGGFKLFK